MWDLSTGGGRRGPAPQRGEERSLMVSPFFLLASAQHRPHGAPQSNPGDPSLSSLPQQPFPRPGRLGPSHPRAAAFPVPTATPT